MARVKYLTGNTTKIVHNHEIKYHEIIYQGPAAKLTAHVASVINRVLMLMVA